MKKAIFLTDSRSTLPHLGCSAPQMRPGPVKKVHLIFKTHLDIGFTDLGANVINKYFEHFIPSAISLSEQMRKNAETDRFVWTTGSWLIYEFLERSSANNRRRMERAIENGDIVWHGLPFTTHSELMDDSLFLLGTRFSAELDKRFDRKTIAAKMTDVPGHTRGIIKPMAGAGLRFLHIGVNSASTPPDVPELFTWKGADNCELVVMYQRDYGSVMTLPGGRTAVSINFTGDNDGPQSPEQIADIYQGLRKRFPEAKVAASSLNAVAEDVIAQKKRLPVITQELGDTWIHGTASDPMRAGQFRELSRLRTEWIAAGKINEYGPTDIAFGGKLMMVAEHTWGLDVKSHLNDWSVYEQSLFKNSRTKPNFRKIEASWREKREYISEAVKTLPKKLAGEATERLKTLVPVRTTANNYEAISNPADVIETDHFDIAFDPETGAVNTLKDHKTKRNWSGKENPLVLFAYQTFSTEDYNRFLGQYLTQRTDWALKDFGKPGLEIASPQSRIFLPRLKKALFYRGKADHRIRLEMDVPDTANTGCPGELVTELVLPSSEPVVHVDFKWFNKPAFRQPEALWLSFVLRIINKDGFRMDKMGQDVSPLDIISKGNRSLHGVIKGIKYEDRKGKFNIESPDAFLVAPGGKKLLKFDNRQPDMSKGLGFCLCNNVWGTNFVMWFEEDMRFRFTLRFG